MKEEIEKVLGDETYTTNEERVNAITASLATLVFPKDKFNEVNAKLKTSESNYATLQSEFEDFKQSKMTADEKAEADRKNFEAKEKNNNLRESKLAVKELLFDNGIKITEEDTELNEILTNVISEDYEKSINLAKSFISFYKKTQDTTQKQTVTDLLNNTPKPVVGNPNAGNVSNLEKLQEQFKEAVKSKDVIAQVQLTRLINEEQNKKTM